MPILQKRLVSPSSISNTSQLGLINDNTFSSNPSIPVSQRVHPLAQNILMSRGSPTICSLTLINSWQEAIISIKSRLGLPNPKKLTFSFFLILILEKSYKMFSNQTDFSLYLRVWTPQRSRSFSVKVPVLSKQMIETFPLTVIFYGYMQQIFFFLNLCKAKVTPIARAVGNAGGTVTVTKSKKL